MNENDTEGIALPLHRTTTLGYCIWFLVLLGSPDAATAARSSEATLPKHIQSVSDAGAARRWLDDQYSSVHDLEGFTACVTKVARLIADAGIPTPKYIKWDPIANGTPREQEWIRTNRAEWKQLGQPDSFASWQASHSNDWANFQDAWKAEHPAPWEAKETTPASDDLQRDSKLRRDAAVLFLDYAKSPKLLHECRLVLVEGVGAALPASDFEEFRRLVMYDLFRIVLKERAERGVVVDSIESEPEKTLVRRVATGATEITAPSEAFSALAVGLFRAAQSRSPEMAQEIRHDLAFVVQWAPWDSEGRETTVLRLAFGDDRNPSSARNSGFFRLLFQNTYQGREDLFHTATEVLNYSDLNAKIALSYALLKKTINELTEDLKQLRGRVDELERRVVALEERVARLEYQVSRLWIAIRETRDFVIEYGEFRKDQRNLRLPVNPTTPSGLDPKQEDGLLRRLAPILLTDTGKASRPEEANTETVVSPKWLVEKCGLASQTPPPIPIFEPAFDSSANHNLAKLVPLVADTRNLWVNCQQYSPERNGPMGTKAASLTNAIANGDGVFGLVQKLGRTMYSVQYYVFFPYNSAIIQELGPWEFNHAGDWLCIDLTVNLLAGDVENPIVVLAYYHNHGPVIEVEPSALEMEDLHVRAYLEFGVNEPEPRAGGQGDRHTEVPGIRRNRRIKNTPFGWLNELIEVASVRPHRGNGYRYDTSKAVKNLRSDDVECKFICAYQGVWGIGGDSPQSPYWNNTMRKREFAFAR